MIIDALLSLVGLLVDALTSLLPDVEIPFWEEVLELAGILNGYLFVFDGLLPLRDLAVVCRWAGTVWLPGYLAFQIFRWVWSHVPVLGSGGS